MINKIENISWFVFTSLIVGGFAVERIFGPPAITLWLWTWLASKLKLNLRLWFTLAGVTLVLALSYSLSFGLASLIVGGLTFLSFYFKRQHPLWPMLGVILASGLICWIKRLYLGSYGWWLLTITGVVASWQLKNFFYSQNKQVTKWFNTP